MSDLGLRYDAMFLEAMKCFSKNDYVLDINIDDVHDNRFGLILNVCPNAAVKSKVEEFQRRFEAIDAEQYYYPANDLHFTVIAIVSCKEGFTISGLDIEAYKQVIRDVLSLVEPFEIKCSGLTAFPGGIMVQGFPAGDRLNVIRDSLRTEFNTSLLFHSIDSRYRIQTAHSTIIRFIKPLRNIRLLQEFLEENRKIHFGDFTVQDILIFYCDWYHIEMYTVVLGNFNL
jgi:2'-5' RNA ligase